VPPDCLAQIANELHIHQMVYGSVSRAGRGRSAPLRINVLLYENSGHTSRPAEPVELARATAEDADGISMRQTAQRLIGTLLPAPTVQVVTPPPVVPVSSPAPVRRYVGIATAAVGGALLIGGIVSGVLWFTLQNEQNGPNTQWTCYRANYDDAQYAMVCSMVMRDPGPRIPNGGDVCAAAAEASPPQQSVLDVCAASRARSGAAYGLTAAGVVLLAAGVVLAVTDHTGSEPTPPPGATATASNAALRMRLRAPQWNVTPLASPTLQGASFSLRF
jgi:hypothetical protein